MDAAISTSYNCFENDDYFFDLQQLELDRRMGAASRARTGTTGHYHDYSSSPEAPAGYCKNSGATATVVATSTAVAAAINEYTADKEKLRRMRLNDKLYALRSVVPIITKMDKASAIKDAIEYIQLLQQREKQLLTEIAAVSPTKKARPTPPSLPSTAAPPCPAATVSPPVRAPLQVAVWAAGDKVLVVSVTCRHRREAIVKVSRAIDELGLGAVVAANVTSASGTVTHTTLIEVTMQAASEQLYVILVYM